MVHWERPVLPCHRKATEGSSPWLSAAGDGRWAALRGRASGWTLRITDAGCEARHAIVDWPSAERSTKIWPVARAPTSPPAGEQDVCEAQSWQRCCGDFGNAHHP